MRPVLGLLAAVACASVAAACGSSSDAAPRPLTVVVSPHPDDEIQAWGALGEDRQDGDVVTVFLTKGEQTAYCAPELPGLDEAAGERVPQPRPEGSFSESCRAARVASTIRFLAEMHEVDPAFPAPSAEATVVGPLPTDTELCRTDATEDCAGDSAVVDVHPASDGASAIFFDLGDDDLTREEVVWAIEALVAHRDELGLPPDRPFGDLIGASYANTDPDSTCAPYDHPDHVVVSEVLLDTEFEAFRSQIVPVCADAFDTARPMPVAPELFDAVFAVDGDRRIGAHTVEYGWLLDPYWVGDVGPGQAELFHRDQWFVHAFH